MINPLDPFVIETGAKLISDGYHRGMAIILKKVCDDFGLYNLIDEDFVKEHASSLDINKLIEECEKIDIDLDEAFTSNLIDNYYAKKNKPRPVHQTSLSLSEKESKELKESVNKVINHEENYMKDISQSLKEIASSLKTIEQGVVSVDEFVEEVNNDN